MFQLLIQIGRRYSERNRLFIIGFGKCFPLELVNKLLVENPDDATLYVARADIEREMEHLELALVDLEEAIRLSSSLMDAYLLRGDIYLLQKRKALAKADYEKAISLVVPPSDLYRRV